MIQERLCRVCFGIDPENCEACNGEGVELTHLDQLGKEIKEEEDQ